jgi:folate-binding protein YgfZ
MELCRLGASPKKVYENRLPFQFNFDMLNAISLKKGCYLGQELVSRGYLASIIRKRVFPFEVEGKSEGLKVDDQSIIRLESGEEIGKVLTVEGKIGLALVNYWSIFEKKY